MKNNLKSVVLIVLLAMALPAVGQTSGNESATSEAAQEILSGTLQNWDQGEAVIAVTSIGADGSPLGNIAEAPVAEDGSFGLELPAEVPANLLSEIDASLMCPSGGITFSPESFQGVAALALMVFQNEAPLGLVVQGSSEAPSASPFASPEQQAEVGDFYVPRIYADRPVSIQGTCDYGGAPQSFDWELQPGWNTLISRTTAVSEGRATEYEAVIASIPSEANWYFIPMPEEMMGGQDTGGN